MQQRMAEAYRAARHIVEEKLSKEEKWILREVEDADVVVVRGEYDRVQDVLGIMKIPHRKVRPDQVGDLDRRRGQMLIVNCPGHVPVAALSTIRSFVESGGTLFTTDWALKHVLEPAFPGLVAYNERPTADEVVRVAIKDRSNPLLDGVFAEGTDPVWWLEGSSYPIRVVDRERVRSILTSAELEERYGEPAVAVHFRAGEGEVLHMISHYYLQRTETRTTRHEGNWKAYAAQVGAPGAALRMEGGENLRVVDVEAAHTALGFISRAIIETQRRKCGSKR
jgi:hypothetical protein